jgi:hypothetical protein
VFDDAEVFGSAKVCRNAKVYGNAEVYGDAFVRGNAQVYDRGSVLGNTEIYDNAQVYECGGISGYVKLYGNAKVYGDARVTSYIEISGDATISKTTDIFIVGPITGPIENYFVFMKSNDDIIVSYKDIYFGSFFGSLKDLKIEIAKKYKTSCVVSMLTNIIELAETYMV